LGVFTNNSIVFFIDVLTWHGHQRPLEAFIYQCCVFSINKECQWLYRERKLLPSQGGMLLQRNFFSKLGVLSSLLPLSLVDMLHMMGGGFGI
jgi:hypothetical protein